MARPRIFQFSLRLLLVGVTLFCVFLGRVVHTASKQRVATAGLRKLGVSVFYDWQPSLVDLRELRNRDFGKYLYAVLYDRGGQCPGPDWIRDIVGDDYFQTVVEIKIAAGSTDEEFAAAMRYILMLPSVSHLSLPGARITDATLKSVSDLPCLESIYLDATQITDDGVAILCKIKTLKCVSVGDTKISAKGISMLLGLPNIESLGLEALPVNEQHLRYMRNLKCLRDLYLGGTKIDDGSIGELSGLRNLRHLYLTNTGLTIEGWQELAHALPNCQLVDDDAEHWNPKAK